jgi:hypothetical protein
MATLWITVPQFGQYFIWIISHFYRTLNPASIGAIGGLFFSGCDEFISGVANHFMSFYEQAYF